MTQAVGRTTRPGAWPRPALVPPRGIRELAWLGAVAPACALPLALQAGPYFLATSIILGVLLRPRPRTLLLTAAATLTAWIVAGTLTSGATQTVERAWHVLTHQLPADPNAVALLDTLALGLTAGLTAVATVMAYDTRRVTRGVVDERVWERQHKRRVEILRREARTQPPRLTAL